jgi:hypothetical protein
MTGEHWCDATILAVLRLYCVTYYSRAVDLHTTTTSISSSQRAALVASSTQLRMMSHSTACNMAPQSL